jgi:hypothetical protein
MSRHTRHPRTPPSPASEQCVGHTPGVARGWS